MEGVRTVPYFSVKPKSWEKDDNDVGVRTAVEMEEYWASLSPALTWYQAPYAH